MSSSFAQIQSQFLCVYSGIGGFGEKNLSYVTVEFLNATSTGQSSQRVHVLDDGSFTSSSDWTLEHPGTYQISTYKYKSKRYQ